MILGDPMRRSRFVALATLAALSALAACRGPGSSSGDAAPTPSGAIVASSAAPVAVSSAAARPPLRARAKNDKELPTTSANIALGNLDAQITELTRLVKVDPKNVSRRRMLSGALNVRGKHRGDLDEIQLGIDEISRAIALEPKNADLYLDRANQEQSLHRFKEARADVAMARSLGAHAPDLAAVDQELDWNDGRYDTAIAAILSARNARKSTATVARVAQLEHDLGHEELADREFEEAEDLYDDTNPIPLAWLDVQRGLHAMKTGRIEQAVELYREAVRRIPTFIMAGEHLAEALHRLGKDDEAIAIYEDLVKRSSDPELMGALASIYRAHRRVKEADALKAKAARRYDELLAKYPEAMYWHASEFFAGEGADPKKAVELLIKNLALRPNSVSLVALAKAHLAVGDVRRARASIDRALAMPVVSAELYFTAARTYARSSEASDRAKRAKLFADAKAIDPRIAETEPEIDSDAGAP
jgi:tetratricopeptide (TPR) repeat protein